MVQMEIVTDILQPSVEVTKTFLLILVWLVYIASQVLILLLAMREVPPEPLPIPLAFEKFNGDMILEIFRHYVSSHPEKAFVLTLLFTFQKEIITYILQGSVKVIKTLLLISVWLVYIASQILIPVAMGEGPLPLLFERLDGDIILEILRYYVSSQPDGAFILTLVSTSWRDFVLRSPILWQWITVDEQSPDWIEKACLSATLAGACPLQIVLWLPIMEWDPLIPLLSRCQNLFFEIPDFMTGRDVDQGTEKLLRAFKTPHNCSFHYHRAGEYVLQEGREQISIDLSNLLNLEMVADGSEHPNYHNYARTRHRRHFELGDAYHPLNSIAC